MTTGKREGTWFPKCAEVHISNQACPIPGHKAKNGIVSGSCYNGFIGPVLTTAKRIL